jgi:tetratricopeptide (TPR) repeat protein
MDPRSPGDVDWDDWLRFQVIRREAEELFTSDFRKAIELDPSDARAYGKLGAVLAKLGKLDDAVAALRNAFELDPKDAEASSNLGRALNSLAWDLVADPAPARRDPDRAVSLAKEAVERAPGQGYIVNTLGTAYYRAGDWKAAIETLKDAAELYQGQRFSSDAFFIAMAYWQLGDREAARKWYLAAERWMDKFASTNEEQRRYRTEAAALIGMPEPVPAEPRPPAQDDRHLYTIILDAWPGAAWAYLRRGQVYDHAGESEQAQADYRQAIDLYQHAVDQHPKSWVPWVYRGSAHAELEQWDKAAGDLDQGAELGAAPAVWYQAALARLGAADMVGYHRACGRILQRLDKVGAGAPAYLALWACALGPNAAADLAPAIALAEKMTDADPKSAQHMGTLGAILYRIGRFEEAALKLEEADRLAQKTDDVASSPAYTWFFLAMAHHRAGHADQARKWFDQAREYTDKAFKDHAAHKVTLPWNRRLTLTLLRRETEDLLGLGGAPVLQLEPK